MSGIIGSAGSKSSGIIGDTGLSQKSGFIDQPVAIGSATWDSTYTVTGVLNSSSSNRAWYSKIGDVVTYSYHADMNPPRNASAINRHGSVYIKLPFPYLSGLTGLAMSNFEYGWPATTYNGSWDLNRDWVWTATTIPTYLVLRTGSYAEYAQSAGTRLILNFTITYLSA